MRRRKARGTWFPVFGDTAGAVEAQSVDVAGIDGSFALRNNGSLSTQVHTLTLDDPKESTIADTNTLADILGSEYLLRRIVGKFHCLHSGSSESPIYAYVVAGFFVARADPENSFYPLGAGTNLIEDKYPAESFAPAAQATMREPWLWRRSWILGNAGNNRQTSPLGLGTETAAAAWDNFPQSTSKYGSVLDGPHVDAKTLRRVGQDDRLYFAVSAVRWPISTQPDPQAEDGLMVYHLDYRIFGSLRKAKQTGSF